METWKRICIKDYKIIDENGTTFKLERGKEYLTSGINAYPSINPELKPETKGYVVVLSKYWVSVPISLFAGEIKQ